MISNIPLKPSSLRFTWISYNSFVTSYSNSKGVIPLCIGIKRVPYLIGRPIGISFMNGQGTSGFLCGVQNNQLFVYEYLYQAQFAMKHYDFRQIQDIHAFPNCPHQNPLY